MFSRGTAIVTAAAICAGGFALLTQPTVGQSTEAATAKITERPPAYEGGVQPVGFTLRSSVDGAVSVPQSSHAEAKGDLRAALSNDCSTQTWPHIDAACLQNADGVDIATKIRTVSIQNDVMRNTSIVSRDVPTQTASR